MKNRKLGIEYSFAFVTDGQYDIGKYLKTTCTVSSLANYLSTMELMINCILFVRRYQALTFLPTASIGLILGSPFPSFIALLFESRLIKWSI